MKNKFLVICMILVSVITAKSTYANTTPPAKVSNYEAVIGDFIDSYMNSNYKKLDEVLGDNACVKIPRMQTVIVQNKASLLDKMREDKGVKQNCTSSYEIIAKSDAIVMARVDFQYTNFKQQNFIVMEKNADGEWKITQIYKISQNNNKQELSPEVVAAN